MKNILLSFFLLIEKINGKVKFLYPAVSQEPGQYLLFPILAQLFFHPGKKKNFYLAPLKNHKNLRFRQEKSEVYYNILPYQLMLIHNSITGIEISIGMFYLGDVTQRHTVRIVFGIITRSA
jgi:hypothetical protein